MIEPPTNDDGPGTKDQEPGTKDQGPRTRDQGRSRRLLFVNQFLPPDPAPTARLLGDLAEELRRRGHEVDFAGGRAGYRGGKTVLGSRALREGLALAGIFFRVLAARRADAIVSLTSPPLLPVAVHAAGLAHRGAGRIHWAMDLYPEVAVALGELREGSLLHRITASLMRRAFRACDLVVALDAEMAARFAEKGVGCEIVPPWPPESTGSGPARPRESGTFTWLYSGNLGRAHEWRTLLAAQSLLEGGGERIDLIFQGGGNEVGAARGEAERLGLRRCRWLPYAAGEELAASLLAADALVATQRPETAGCLWPSKLALMRLSGRDLVWVGPAGGEIARTLRDEGHGVFAPGEAGALADHLKRLAAGPPEAGPPEARRAGEVEDLAARVAVARAEGVGRLADRIEEVLARNGTRQR